MTVSLVEEGVTRIRDVFVVSAPILGCVLRIEIEEGDEVIAGETVLAEIEPTAPAFLDFRTEAEARAAVRVAEAALALARSELTEAEAERDFMTDELARIRELRASGTVSARALEDAERLYRKATGRVATLGAAVTMRGSELEAARVRLLRPTEEDTPGTCPRVPIRAPISGRMLRVLHESAGVVGAGEPLIAIGDPGDLEVVADFLSSKAVRMAPGQRALIEAWGGGGALAAEVTRVEPYGFTKVSALGIKEQRINVVLALEAAAADWARLDHGFEVDAHVVLWEGADILLVPLTALFRHGEGCEVYRVSGGRASVAEVEIGRRTDLAAQVTEGLAPGDRVIRYPGHFIEPGLRVTARGS